MEHHHEGRQQPGRAADLHAAEVAPVHLGLLARQGAQAQVGLGGLARPQAADDATEVVGAAGVAALGDHPVQAAGRQGRVLLEGLVDERQVGVHHGRPWLLRHGDAAAVQHAPHGAVVDAALARDGAHRPLLDEVEPEDALLEVGGDHASPRGRAAAAVVWTQEVAPREGGQGALAVTAAKRGDAGDGGRVMRELLAPAVGDRSRRGPCLCLRFGGTLVRHLRCAPLEVPLLSCGVVGAA